MAEIASTVSVFSSPSLRKILLLTGILFCSPAFFSQDLPKQKPGKKMIEVLNADDGIDEIEKYTGKRLTRLLGNVSLKHNDIFMTCDSAWFYTDYNQIKAYSRIHMTAGRYTST